MRRDASESSTHPTVDNLPREIESALRLDEGALTEDGNLFELGLDSFTVIRLAAEWRCCGLDVTFEELVDEPTLRQWRAVLMRAAESKPPRRYGDHH